MRLKQFIFTSLLLLPILAHAQIDNMGSVGNVWEIDEPDQIDVIKNKLSVMYSNGTMKKIEDGWKKKALSRVYDGPDPLPGFSTTTTDKVTLFDPTLTIPEDIRDASGRLVASAGTSVNPLDYMNLGQKYLLFFDGRDDKQVEWAVKIKKEAPLSKLILVAGSPYALTQKYKYNFYFDQSSMLSGKWGIHHSPTIVKQKGNRLEIHEVAKY